MPCRVNLTQVKRLFCIQLRAEKWKYRARNKENKKSKRRTARFSFFSRLFSLIYSMRDSLITTIKIEFLCQWDFVEVLHCQYSCNYIFIVRGFFDLSIWTNIFGLFLFRLVLLNKTWNCGIILQQSFSH